MVAVSSRISIDDAFSIFDIKSVPPPSHLKRLYRQLAKIHHPDKGGDKSFFLRIGEAYELLQDCIKNPHKVPSHFRRSSEHQVKIYEPVTREQVKKRLTEEQWVVAQEVLEWLANPYGQSELLMEGAAGVGKTYLIQAILEIANSEGLLGDGWVFGCAPQNPQKNVLRHSLGNYAHEYFTIHSLLNLRPKVVTFTARDQYKLEQLLSINPEHRTEAEQFKIIELQQQAQQAAKKEKEFQPITEPDLSGVRLIIVDEAGMLGDRLLWLLREALGRGDSTLQILYMGDRAQLKPINGREKLKPGQRLSAKTQALYDAGFSLVFAVPSTTPLIEPIRYSGAIKEYVEKVRLYALGEKTGDEFTRLHRSISIDETDNSLMVLPSFQVFDPEALQDVFTQHSCRFVAMRNDRVDELNYVIGHLLRDGKVSPRQLQGVGVIAKGKSSASSSNLFFMEGDIVLTMSPVARALSEVYGLEANENGAPQINTSTLIQLKRMVDIKEKIHVEKGMNAYCPSGTVTIQKEFLQYKSVLGTTFHRSLYHYDIYGDDSETPRDHVIALLEPEQRSKWKEELETLRSQAMSTVSRGKSIETSRGQNGDKAEAAWERYGLKNWFYRKDGSELTVSEYDDIRTSLWRDYYILKNFVDQANFSWASTCHRAQGMTVDIVVLDMSDLLKTRNWGTQDLQELAQLLYTAATRARVQVIFLV